MHLNNGEGESHLVFQLQPSLLDLVDEDGGAYNEESLDFPTIVDILKVFDLDQLLEGRFSTVVADRAAVTDDVEDIVVEPEHLHFFKRLPEF